MKSVLVFASLAAAVASWNSLSASTLIFSENFDGLALGPYVSPTESGGDGTDWTDIAPAGWLRENGATPVGNPPEFFGWTFHDRTSWIATEGDQQRSAWTGGSGTVMVADPDAYDDGTNIDTALFNTFMTLPAVSLSGRNTNTLTLRFDSSFRAEATQIAVLDVSLNGGAFFTRLLTLDGNTLPDGQLFNDPVVAQVTHGGSGNALFRLGLIDGSNDWWWAVDNVQIFDGAIPEPSTALLAVLPLALALRRRR